MLTQAATSANISPTLLSALVWQESRWNPQAVSPKGAMGLAQLMPATARDLGVNPPIPCRTSRAARATFAHLLDQFDGDVEKALAAYNAGPGRVRSAGGVPAIAETRNYVRVDRPPHFIFDFDRSKPMTIKTQPRGTAADRAERARRPLAQANPQGSGPIVSALAGCRAPCSAMSRPSVAVIAVAMVGFMMLTGRLNWRFGATVIIGCFILFGSAAIVSGIQSTAAVSG